MTLMTKLPTPLRAVFRAPPGPAGSQTNTASHCEASFSVSARELSLPSSSSETSQTFNGRGRLPFTSRSARIANMICAMPLFMSKTPGPARRSCSRARAWFLECLSHRRCRNGQAAGPACVREGQRIQQEDGCRL